MNINKYLSRKIKFISLFSMFAVVFIHSYNYKDNFLTPTTSISEGFNFFAMFEYFISNGLARFAVPLFFIISGFLYFKNFASIKESYVKKLKSRVFSLVVPYCLWALISALFMFALTFVSITANTEIVKESIPSGAYSLLTCLIDPPAFQLWYIQQLIIFAIISPVFYFLIKYTKGIMLIIFAVPWIFDLHFIINSQALFFFSVGSYLGIFNLDKLMINSETTTVKYISIKNNGFSFSNGNRIFTVVITLCWIITSAVITVLASMEFDNPAITFIRLLLYRLNEVIGVIAAWVLFDHIFKRIINKKLLVLTSNYLFFIYAMHEPILHLSYQLGLMSKSSDISHLVLFIFMPICTMAICIIAGMIVRKFSKPVFSALTGGRKTILKYKQ